MVAFTSTAISQIQNLANTSRYKLIWTRQDDGVASAELIDTTTNQSVLSGPSLAWDDTIPWESGTYLCTPISARHGTPPAPRWALSPSPANRDAIQLHLGNTSDNSWGCLVAPRGFLDDLKSITNGEAFTIDVINDFPLSISLSANQSTAAEGNEIRLFVDLNQPVSKDIWVKVELDESSSTAQSNDITIINSNLRELKNVPNSSTGGVFNGYFVKIAEGSTRGEIRVKLNPDAQNEAPETARFQIVDYAVSDDRPTNPDFRFYRDKTKLNIDKANDFEIITITETELPLIRNGSSGQYPYSLPVSQGQVYSVSFQDYTIQDALRITDGGRILFEIPSGSSLSSGQFTIQSSTTGQINIVVDGNSDPGTAWDLRVDLVSNGTSSSIQRILSASSSQTATSETRNANSLNELVPDVVQQGSLTNSTTAQSFTATLQSNRLYLLHVGTTTLDLDPTLTVRNSFNQPVLTTNDRFGDVLPFTFMTSASNEIVSIDVNGQNGTTGNFEIILEDVTGSRANVVYVQSNVSIINEISAASGDGNVSEGINITIYRDGDISQAQTISWSISAAQNSSFTISDLSGIPASGQFTFDANEFIEVISFDAIQDNRTENIEDFVFTITNGGGGVTSTLASAGLTGTVRLSIIDSFDVAQVKTGTAGPDDMIGSSLSDQLTGDFGDDNISGQGSADKLFGDAGSDTLFGDDGNDIIRGGSESDRLYGDDDYNTPQVSIGSGIADLNNKVSLPLSIGGSLVAVDLSNGYSYNSNANIADSTISPHISATRISTGELHYYSITVVAPIAASFDIDGGDEFDSYLTLYDSSGAIVATADDSAISVGAGGSSSGFDSFLTYNFLNAGTYYLEVSEYPGSAQIPNGATYDLHVSFIVGTTDHPRSFAPGSDLIYGDDGDDRLDGGAGNDSLWGGNNADEHIGGIGYDYARYDDANYGNLRISLIAPSTNTGAAAVGDTYSGIEGVIAGAGNDVVYGNGEANILDGRAGNDTIFGGLGADSIRGGDGVDYARYDDVNYGNLVLSLANAAQNQGTGAAGDLYNSIEGIIAGVGNDRVGGNGFINYLYGLAGDDIIAGNAGNDTLSGGAGRDTFIFNTALNAATNRDTILDFVAADDTIQLDRSFFSNTIPLGVLRADLFHTGAAAADAGDRIIYNQSTGALFFDADGSGTGFAAVQFATLTTKPVITNADFVIVA